MGLKAYLEYSYLVDQLDEGKNDGNHRQYMLIHPYSLASKKLKYSHDQLHQQYLLLFQLF